MSRAFLEKISLFFIFFEKTGKNQFENPLSTNNSQKSSVQDHFKGVESAKNNRTPRKKAPTPSRHSFFAAFRRCFPWEINELAPTENLSQPDAGVFQTN